jgi:ACS family glucarate transporter-like MFS transporter
VVVLPWGMVVDRIGTKKSTAAGMALWSLATLMTGGCWNLFSAFISRLAMGFGEGATYPAGGRTIREWIPSRERGLATVIFNCGGYAGPAFGSIAMAYVVSQYGWRVGFYVAGALGLVWLVFWLAVFRQPEDARFIGEQERAKILAERGGAARQGASARLADLLRCKSLWGVAITQGCAVYTVYLFLTWLPTYLQVSRGLTLLKTGVFTAVPYAVAVPGTIFIGWLSDRLLDPAHVSTGSRRKLVAVLMLCSSCMVATRWITDTWAILAVFSLSLTCIGSAVGLNIALTNDLLRNPANTGRAHGFLVTGGNLFGVGAPIATGYIISGTGSYDAAFIAAGVLLLVGALVVMTMTRDPIAPEELLPAGGAALSRAER